LLVACAPSALRELPPVPAGADAVAIVGGDQGTLLRLPVEDGVFVAGEDAEVQFHALGALLDRPRTPIEVALGCEERGLPAPLSSWVLGADGAREAPPRSLRAPELSCAGSGSLIFAPIDAVAPCRRAELNAVECGLQVDFTSCMRGGGAPWPTRIDGRPCGPPPGDSQCSPVDEVPAAAVAAGRCVDSTYALYRAEPFSRSRRAPCLRWWGAAIPAECARRLH